MKETKDMDVIFRLGTEELTTLLNESGYQTIFDITKESFTEFEENNSNILSSDLREIYQLAEQRKENLHMLFKAWQLHNDPLIQKNSKLSSDTGMQGMRLALSRSLSGSLGFGDLFPERSLEGYAEASSIQSLFSPGRYLTILYKIARQLLNADNILHIDRRRPELQSLLLTTDNMNREVSSLDVLIDVLQSGDPDTLESLKETYYPMTLPYDDHLTQINAVLESHSSHLLKNWDVLLDKQRSSFLQSSATVLQESRRWRFDPQDQQESRNITTPFPSTRELLDLTPNTFQLLINDHPTVENVAKHYNVNVSTNQPHRDLANALNVVDEFCKKTGLSFNDLLNLTAQDDHTNPSREYKSRFIKFGEKENAPVSTYGAAFLTGLETPLWMKQYEGVVTERRVPEDDAHVRAGTFVDRNFGLEDHLVVMESIPNNTRESYLKFDLSGFSHPVKSAKISLTSVNVGTPFMRHQARLVHDNSWDERLITWNNRPRGAEIIATWSVPEVGRSVGIDITQQVNAALARGMQFLSLVISAIRDYGQQGEMRYASKEHANQAHAPFIEIKGEKSPTLNFTEDNVVTLAGRAEKLIRLAQRTGLSFEQLDWLIQNANIGASDIGQKITVAKSPEDDAFVRGGRYATENFGLEDRLVVKEDNPNFHRESYLKFDLSGFSHPIDHASLLLTVRHRQISDVTNQARIVNNNHWNEQTITWNNRPAGADIIATWSVPEVGRTVEIDITQQVNAALARGMQFLSLVISATRDYGPHGDVSYFSKEHETRVNRPIIVVTRRQI